jgi:tetratricopeptide (TPR) repeat protein
MIARLQQAKGDNEAAVKTLEQVLAREDQLLPQDRESALRFGGTLYLLVNAADKSSKCYEKLLALAPDDMTALNNMACLLAEVMQPPRPQDGLAYSERAYNLMRQGGRRDALVLDTHGWLLTLCGRVDEGIEILRMANEMKPLPDAHYHLAEAYLRKQFADQALKELEIALDLIKRSEQEKTPVDPLLKSKVENAMSRAGVMQRSKKTTAVAPTATNVP